MARDRWEAIKSIFGVAVDLPPAERSAYLRRACVGDPTLHSNVRDLLAIHEEESRRGRETQPEEPHVFQDQDLIAGRFRVIRFIARGGMGEVYEVFDEKLRLEIALKTMRVEGAAEPEAMGRFRREIRVAREVWHENLCRVFDLVEHEDARGVAIACLTMELLKGETLSARLQRDRPLPVEVAAPLIRQIAAGLEMLHSRGIIHRDLKPSNIMVVPCGGGKVRAVVMDFGLARQVPSDGAGECFESLGRFHAGAPFFMAPELLREDLPPSVASDIYAFGLVIDELVTESPAFPTTSLQSLWFAKLLEQPVRPGARAKALPPNWEQAILRCVDPDPKRRFGRPSEVVAALETPSAGLVAEAPPKAVPVRAPSLLRRRALILGAVGLPAASGAAAIASLAFQRVNTSIEVFDIENQTNHQELDYFCKGMTAELMRRLTHVDGVRVIPLHRYRSSPGERKPSRFGLDGMLQAYQGRIRMSVSLTDNEDGTLVWSDNFDRRQVDNPLELQSEIARGAVAAFENRALLAGSGLMSQRLLSAPIVSRMRSLLASPLQAQLLQAPTSSNSALDLYMRGHNLLEEVSGESTQAAIGYFQRAVGEDPNFALAYAALADAKITLMNYSYAPDPELIAAAEKFAQKSIQADPNLAEGYASLGAVRQVNWDWTGSEQNYLRALEMKPGFARARRRYAGLILQFGRFDEALEHGRRAFDQDPYDRSSPAYFGLYLFLAGKVREAVDLLAPTVVGKDMPGARQNLGQFYARLGQLTSGAESAEYYRRAFAEADAVAASESRSLPQDGSVQPSLADQMRALFHSLAGGAQAAEPFLQRLRAQMKAEKLSPVVLAWVYAVQARHSEALDMLELAARWRDRKLLYMKVNPFLETLRGQARFQNLLAQMRL